MPVCRPPSREEKRSLPIYRPRELETSRQKVGSCLLLFFLPRANHVTAGGQEKIYESLYATVLSCIGILAFPAVGRNGKTARRSGSGSMAGGRGRRNRRSEMGGQMLNRLSRNVLHSCLSAWPGMVQAEVSPRGPVGNGLRVAVW